MDRRGRRSDRTEGSLFRSLLNTPTAPALRAFRCRRLFRPAWLAVPIVFLRMMMPVCEVFEMTFEFEFVHGPQPAIVQV